MRIPLVAVSVLLISAHTAFAATIQQPYVYGGFQISAHTPIGQTFIAIDPSIDIAAFDVFDANPDAADFTLSYVLYDGAGVAGSLLGSATATVVPGQEGWAPASFGGIPVTVGNAYTLVIADTTPRWAVRALFLDPAYASLNYAEGVSMISGTLQANLDMTFYIGPDAPPIIELPVPPPPLPEPAALALIGGGLVALLARQRARRIRSHRTPTRPCANPLRLKRGIPTGG
jgi:hypothetical protein